MDAISYSAARAKLAETMQRVCDNHEPVIITRRKARPVVLVSLEDWNAIEETAYLLKSPANAQRLRQSLASAQAGEVQTSPLIEP